MRLQLSSWLLAAGGLLLPALATADDHSTEGVVRLGSVPPSAHSAPSQIPGTTEHVGFHQLHAGSCGDGECGYGCGSDYSCPSAGGCYSGCPSACGYGCNPCGYGTCGSCGCSYGGCKLCDALRCRPVGGCHYSPDHGWAPPGKHPRPRTAATYRNWFPAAWTGEGSYAESGYRYPMVYTPTDTTQLGYYYQRVPVWQHRAGMIPPVPQPEQFHVPNFGVCCNGVVGDAPCGHYGEIVGDYAAGGDYYDSSSEPSLPVEPAPVETQPAPTPAPAQDGNAEPYVPPAPAPAPEAPPAEGTSASGLEKSALAPYLFPTPQR